MLCQNYDWSACRFSCPSGSIFRVTYRQILLINLLSTVAFFTFPTDFPASRSDGDRSNVRKGMTCSASGPCPNTMPEVRPVSVPIFVRPHSRSRYFSRRGRGVLAPVAYSRFMHILRNCGGRGMHPLLVAFPIHLTKKRTIHTCLHICMHICLYVPRAHAWLSAHTMSEVHACNS